MRVVLDTNILISGIYFGRIPGHIVDAWLDDKFIACARGAKASYLVTGDLDLKTIPEQPDFKIVSPTEFSKILKKNRPH